MSPASCTRAIHVVTDTSIAKPSAADIPERDAPMILRNPPGKRRAWLCLLFIRTFGWQQAGSIRHKNDRSGPFHEGFLKHFFARVIVFDVHHIEALETEMFLYAAGRNGGTNGLALENAGVVLGKRQAVLVNEHYRTNVPHIFAVGDVIGFPALAATGMDQGRVAISHMFDIDDSDRLPKILPYGIYTIPEVSMAGMTEEQAREQKLDYVVGVAHHALTHRGRIMGLKSGFLKIVFIRDTLLIVGCHLIGPLSAELIHFGLGLVVDRKSVNDVVDTVFNYPTLHDLYKYACYDGLGNVAGKKMREF